jgi:ADP-ribose pyrophosphatase
MTKIPSEAKLVFQGKIFAVYQWEQKMFDGSYQTFEMLRRPMTVEVIATAGDMIYLTHQSQPNKADFYSLLGGRGEDDEDPLDAAKRELLEESGFASDDWELFKTYQPVHKIDWDIHTFIARDCRKVAEQKLDVGEQIEVKACSFTEFIEHILSEKYWGTELTLDILRLKDAGELEEFKQKLFQGS